MHYIIIGPSGSGKDTLIKDLLEKKPKSFQKLVSNASRKPRVGEIEGYNYYYLNSFPLKKDFKNYFNYVIYNGNFYGYDWNEVNKKIINEKTKSCLIIVEPSGMQPFIDLFKEKKIEYKTVFIDIDKNTIIERLFKRGDNLEENKERIEKDIEYFSEIKKHCDIILNGTLEKETVTNNFLNIHKKR